MPPDDPPAPAQTAKQDAKRDREAKALRANLARRKQQARDRQAPPPAPAAPTRDDPDPA